MEQIEVSKEQIDSLAEKLESFERDLTAEEREVLAAVFAAAATRGTGEAEVAGFTFDRLGTPGLSLGFRNIFLFRMVPEEEEPPPQP